MKTLILTAATLAALAVCAAATAGVDVTRSPATLTIRHEQVGCHSWSLNGGPYRVEQTVRLREGQTLRVVNYDSNVHRLVKVSGGSLTVSGGQSLLLRSPSSAAIPLPPDPAAHLSTPRSRRPARASWPTGVPP